MKEVRMGGRKLGDRNLIGLLAKNASMLLIITSLSYTNLAWSQAQFTDSTDVAGGSFHIGETWGSSWGYLNDDIYPDLFANNHGMPNSILRNNGDGTFTDVIQEVDLDGALTNEPEADIHGGAWGDFDSDGDEDLFVTRSSRGARVFLLENNGQGQFRERGQVYQIAPYGGGRMPVLFDYTGDGFLDATITRVRDGMEIFQWNPTTQRYVIQSTQTGLEDQCQQNSYGFVSDLFNNGKLHYVCVSEGKMPERVYDTSTFDPNNPNNTSFTDVTSKIDRVSFVTDSVIADFNGDLRLDAFAVRGRVRPSSVSLVASTRIEAWVSAGGSNRLKSFTFQSSGPITIDVHARDVGEPGKVRIGPSGYNPSSLPATIDPTEPSNQGIIHNPLQRAVFVEFNPATQEWTIYLSSGTGTSFEGAYITVNGSNMTEPSTQGFAALDNATEPVFLINNGNRLVQSGARGIGPLSCGGIAAADFDNDMDIDLYLACRTGSANIENRLYLNDGSGNFSLQASSHGAEGPIGAGVEGRLGTAEMATTADYDVDGFMDLYVTNGNRIFPHHVKDGFTGGGPVKFYRNLGNSNKWLELDLEGVTSNRDGFGAKVIVTAGGKAQLREQNGKYHRHSHDDRRLHFGLGSNNRADIRVEWPNGTVDEYTNVNVNRLYKATQGGALEVLSESAGQPSLSVEGVTVSEGNRASVRVSLSQASSSTVTVSYQTVNGSAIAGSDYVSKSGSVTFNPGQTNATVSFETLRDNVAEQNEIFSVSLSNPQNAVIGQASSNVTIVDSQTGNLPVITIYDSQASESDEFARVAITLSEPQSSRVLVDFRTVGRSATADSDYVTRSLGTMAFLPGQTSKIRDIDMLQDDLVEGNEMFELELSNPVGAILGQAVGQITIRDDESSNPSVVNIGDIEVLESEGLAIFPITLSEPVANTVRVAFTTVNGTALAGQDYVARSGFVVFNPGEVSKTRTVTVLQDNIDERLEVFRMELSSPTNIELGQAIAKATVTEEVDTSNTGNSTACGKPDYDAAVDRTVLIWKDCSGDGRWHVIASAGGGGFTSYQGDIVSDQAFSNVSEIGFEPGDMVDVSNPNQIIYQLGVANIWTDEFVFDTNSDDVCFNMTVPQGQTVAVGQARVIVSPPFNFNTLQACN